MIIAYPQVKAIFEGILKEFGEDYVYVSQGQACLYYDEVNPEIPGCAVGQIVYRINKDAWQACNEHGNVIGSLFGVMEAKGVKFTGPARRYLAEMQRKQDRGATWGQAHAAGIEAAEGYADA